jgi:hypothetical protein
MTGESHAEIQSMAASFASFSAISVPSARRIAYGVIVIVSSQKALRATLTTLEKLQPA